MRRERRRRRLQSERDCLRGIELLVLIWVEQIAPFFHCIALPSALIYLVNSHRSRKQPGLLSLPVFVSTRTTDVTGRVIDVILQRWRVFPPRAL
jgi:hypothetical protein